MGTGLFLLTIFTWLGAPPCLYVILLAPAAALMAGVLMGVSDLAEQGRPARPARRREPAAETPAEPPPVKPAHEEDAGQERQGPAAEPIEPGGRKRLDCPYCGTPNEVCEGQTSFDCIDCRLPSDLVSGEARRRI